MIAFAGKLNERFFFIPCGENIHGWGGPDYNTVTATRYSFFVVDDAVL